jgi:hypothetical protein
MKEKKTSDLVASVVFNVIFLVFVNTIPLWQQSTRGVILETWSSVLWAMNLSIGTQIAGNLFLLFYRPRWLSELLRAVNAATGLLSIIVFFIVFPLDFSKVVGPWLNTLVKILCMLGMAGSLIGFIVQIVRFLREAGRALGKAT